MSEDVNKRKSKTILIASTLIIVFLIVPVYGLGVVWAIPQLKIGTPTISVTNEGFTIIVAFSVPIENPSVVPIPTLNAIVDVELDEHTLFYAEATSLGQLNAGGNTTISLRTRVDLAIVPELFGSLTSYLAGNPIAYHIRIVLGFHILTDVNLLTSTSEGHFELY
jgi:LEA14-like dessication related protein